MTIKAVLFDLDETLLDHSTGLEAFLHDQYQRYPPYVAHIPYPTFRDRFIALDQRGYVHKAIVYQQLLLEFAISNLTVAELVADYRTTCWQHGKTFANTPGVLQTLRSWGLKVGIVTNGETDFQSRHIDVTGLAELVDTILISEQEHLRKPDPRLFQRAAERLGVAPNHCLFVGDHPINDMLGAQSAGMSTIWLQHDAAWPAELTVRPTRSIIDIQALLLIVEEWSSSRKDIRTNIASRI